MFVTRKDGLTYAPGVTVNTNPYLNPNPNPNPAHIPNKKTHHNLNPNSL